MQGQKIVVGFGGKVNGKKAIRERKMEQNEVKVIAMHEFTSDERQISAYLCSRSCSHCRLASHTKSLISRACSNCSLPIYSPACQSSARLSQVVRGRRDGIDGGSAGCQVAANGGSDSVPIPIATTSEHFDASRSVLVGEYQAML